MCTQQYNYSCPDALTPVHLYPQCRLDIHFIIVLHAEVLHLLETVLENEITF